MLGEIPKSTRSFMQRKHAYWLLGFVLLGILVQAVYTSTQTSAVSSETMSATTPPPGFIVITNPRDPVGRRERKITLTIRPQGGFTGSEPIPQTFLNNAWVFVPSRCMQGLPAGACFTATGTRYNPELRRNIRFVEWYSFGRVASPTGQPVWEIVGRVESMQGGTEPVTGRYE